MGRKKSKDWRVFWIFGISISHFIKPIVCHQFWIEKPSHLGSEGKTFQDTYTEWLDETNNRSNMVDMPYWIYKTAFDKTEMVWGAFKVSRLSLVSFFVRYCKASILILNESYYRFRWEKSRFYESDLLEFIYSNVNSTVNTVFESDVFHFWYSICFEIINRVLLTDINVFLFSIVPTHIERKSKSGFQFSANELKHLWKQRNQSMVFQVETHKDFLHFNFKSITFFLLRLLYIRNTTSVKTVILNKRP